MYTTLLWSKLVQQIHQSILFIAYRHLLNSGDCTLMYTTTIFPGNLTVARFYFKALFDAVTILGQLDFEATEIDMCIKVLAWALSCGTYVRQEPQW